MKFPLTLLVLTLIGLIAGVVWIAIRFQFGGAEDTWICQKGVWVAHGKPSAPKPPDPCQEQLPDYLQKLRSLL